MEEIDISSVSDEASPRTDGLVVGFRSGEIDEDVTERIGTAEVLEINYDSDTEEEEDHEDVLVKKFEGTDKSGSSSPEKKVSFVKEVLYRNDSPSPSHSVTHENPGNFLRWNIGAVNDPSSSDFTNRYVPSLGYQPLKNVLEEISPSVEQQVKDTLRTSVRIKRPWFYEITIEEEDDFIEEIEEEDETSKENLETLPKIEVTNCEITLKNESDERKLNLVDRNKSDEGAMETLFNLTLQTGLNIKQEDKPTGEKCYPSSDRCQNKNENDSCSVLKKKVAPEKHVKIVLDGDLGNCGEGPASVSFITDSEKPERDTDQSVPDAVKVDSKNTNSTREKEGEKEDEKDKDIKDEEDVVLAGSTQVKSSVLTPKEKHKIKLEVNVTSGSDRSFSDLTSVTPCSICQVCRKRSSHRSTPRTPTSGCWNDRDTKSNVSSDIFTRKQEENIMRHLELIHLGRLLLQNPSDFLRNKSAQQKKPSLFNNRRNMSFSNERLREIAWANNILLKKLVATSRRKPKLQDT